MLLASIIGLVLFLFWQVLPFRKRKNFTRFIYKHINCITLTNFQDTKLYSMQNPSLRFIIKIMLQKNLASMFLLNIFLKNVVPFRYLAHKTAFRGNRPVAIMLVKFWNVAH